MEVLSFITSLPTYPLWVRLIMLVTAIIWFSAYVLLVFFAPTPPPKELSLNDFRQIFSETIPNGLSLNVMVTNNTGETVVLTQARLIYYQDVISMGGLQSYQEISVEYLISRKGEHFFVTAHNGHSSRARVPLIRPYAGQPQMEVVIPISQTIQSGESDRFILTLLDGLSLDSKINKVQITMNYNDDMKISTEADIDLA